MFADDSGFYDEISQFFCTGQSKRCIKRSDEIGAKNWMDLVLQDNNINIGILKIIIQNKIGFSKWFFLN